MFRIRLFHIIIGFLPADLTACKQARSQRKLEHFRSRISPLGLKGTVEMRDPVRFFALRWACGHITPHGSYLIKPKLVAIQIVLPSRAMSEITFLNIPSLKKTAEMSTPSFFTNPLFEAIQ